MVGQCLDKAIETIEVGLFHLFDPSEEPSFPCLNIGGLIENDAQFLAEGIGLMKLWRMGQQGP